MGKETISVSDGSAQFPGFDQFLSTWTQPTQFLSDYGLFAFGGFLSTFVKQRQFLAACASAAKFSLSFSSCHNLWHLAKNGKIDAFNGGKGTVVPEFRQCLSVAVANDLG